MVSTDSRLRAIEKEWAKNPPKRKSFAKSPRILKGKSIQDLVNVNEQISKSKKQTGSLYLYDKKTRAKLNDIGWAIRNKMV